MSPIGASYTCSSEHSHKMLGCDPPIVRLILPKSRLEQKFEKSLSVKRPLAGVIDMPCVKMNTFSRQKTLWLEVKDHTHVSAFINCNVYNVSTVCPLYSFWSQETLIFEWTKFLRHLAFQSESGREFQNLLSVNGFRRIRSLKQKFHSLSMAFLVKNISLLKIPSDFYSRKFST